MNIKQSVGVFKESLSAWSEDYAPSMGAALSYYTLFSIAPLLVIVISVVGLFFGADEVRGALLGQLQGLLGDEGARAIEEMLDTTSQPKEGIIGAITGIALLLIGATTVFGELQDSLDRIWRAPVKEKTSGLWKLLRSRLLSFGMILAVAFLLMISLVVTAVLAALGKWWGPMFGGWEVLAHVFNFVVGIGLTTVLFALIYKIIPRVRVHWHDVWVGSAVTALLFTVGKFAIGFYLGKSDVSSSFGAAGSFVVLMVWVYYSAQIFLVGAEYTWLYAHKYGSRRRMEPPPAPQASKDGMQRAAEKERAAL
jgi:membrane protein